MKVFAFLYLAFPSYRYTEDTHLSHLDLRRLKLVKREHICSQERLADMLWEVMGKKIAKEDQQ